MKKLLTLIFTAFILTGCSTAQVNSEPYTIIGNTITFNNENLTFTLPDNFEATSDSIKFGPETFIPESPTDKIYTRKALTLNLIPSRSEKSLKEAVSAQNELPIDFKSNQLSTTSYITWTEPGMCDFTYYEIIGVENNIKITDWSCEDINTDEIVADFLNSVE